MSRSLLSVLLFIGLIFLSWNFYAQTKGIKLSELQPFAQLFESEEKEEIEPIAEPQKEVETQENFRIEEVFACTITRDTNEGDADQDICEGNAIDDIIYSVDNGGILTVTSGPPWLNIIDDGTSTVRITGTPSGPGTYTYRIDASSGSCSGEFVEGTITVTAPPSAGTLDGIQDICEAGTTTFTSTVGGGVWSSDTPSV
ncbi:MAG: hypothetical protein HWE09_11670, partial [Cyclobacteriaceae bacterium]|nr:hypothetical protein [Cyclobacteriaceae bacterium]